MQNAQGGVDGCPGIETYTFSCCANAKKGSNKQMRTLHLFLLMLTSMQGYFLWWQV